MNYIIGAVWFSMMGFLLGTQVKPIRTDGCPEQNGKLVAYIYMPRNGDITCGYVQAITGMGYDHLVIKRKYGWQSRSKG